MTGLIALSPFGLSFFSTRSPLSPPSPPPFSSLPKSVNLFVCSGLQRTLRELITDWICLSPFDSPFSPPGHLYFFPPSSLLYVTLWTSLRVPDCGEHIGDWLLARLLSPLLIPSLLLLVTSISLLPLLFSTLTLWISLGVPHLEKLFIISLDVLSSVLYRWRSPEATVRIRLKARGRMLKSKIWEHQRTPDSREH